MLVEMLKNIALPSKVLRQRENEKWHEIPLILDLVKAFLKKVQYSLPTVIINRVLICLSF